MVHIGQGHYVTQKRILTVMQSHGNGMKRLRTEKYSENNVIDMTSGHSVGSMILLDDGSLCLSSLQVHEIITNITKG